MNPVDSYNPSPPRIERTPQAEAVEIEQLVQWAKSGRLRIPYFQRKFRWNNKDRISLFDSIERGYPIGTLLFWKRPGTTEGGRFPGSDPPRLGDDALWIVDGQQRITALWDALMRRRVGNEQCLCFDVDSEIPQFRFVPALDATEFPRVPLHVMVDAAELSEWFVHREWPPDRLRRVFAAAKRIRQYKVPIYIVDSDDERVVRDIFGRTNTTGKQLSRDEVFEALAGSVGAPGDAKDLDHVNANLAESGFGSFDRKAILDSLLAISDLRIDTELQKVDRDVAASGLIATTAALKCLGDFLRSSAYIPHAALIPYELPIVVLARFFDAFPNPHPRNRILLRRWIWRASLGQLLGGASGTLQDHVSDVRKEDEHGSVQRLLRRTGSSSVVNLDAQRPLLLNSAMGKLQVCAALAMRPRDLRSGELLAVGELFSQGVEPSIRRIVREVDGQEWIARTIANRLIHPPLKGVGPMRLLLEASDVGALASHGVDSRAIEALRAGDGARFLSIRGELLAMWSQSFFARNAEWLADDSAAIASLRRHG